MKKFLNGSGGAFLALAVLLIVCCVSNESFRSPQNLLNILRQVSFSGIIALGMTFVIAAGGIDLSVGSLLALAGVLSLSGMNAFPDETAGLIAGGGIALGVGLAGGAVNGVLASVWKIPPFIVTLGTLSIFRSLSLYFADAGMITAKNETYRELGDASFAMLPPSVWVLLGGTVVLGTVLARTRFGRHVCAVGSNERVARFSRIHTGLVKFHTYLLVGGLTGISAFLFGSRLGSVSSSGAGASYELDAIAAVIIGGTAMTGGRAFVTGTLAGLLILGIVGNVLDMWGISANLQGTVKGAVIIAAVLIQYRKPRGS